jgi:hypothetical protein
MHGVGGNQHGVGDVHGAAMAAAVAWACPGYVTFTSASRYERDAHSSPWSHSSADTEKAAVVIPVSCVERAIPQHVEMKKACNIADRALCEITSIGSSIEGYNPTKRGVHR